MTDIPRRLDPLESRLDRAIDRAVRDMMDVDPRPGFRRRVLANLDREPLRSSMFFRVALVGAALAVLILAVMVIVPDRRSALPHTVAQRAAPPALTAPQPPAPSSTSVQTPRAPKRTTGVTRERIPMPRVTNVFGERRDAAAATSVEADTVWPAPAPQAHEDSPSAPPPLVIPALEAPAPIVIAPLNPRGPGR
jgi:hypothetical protein